jgi:RpiB/LacA/LacB family sugar-phosphate isomerase
MQTNRIANDQSHSFFECIEYKGPSVRVGLAADGHGHDLKSQLAIALEMAGHDVIDFGTFGVHNHNDYSDFIVPMAESVATGDVTKGLAICGSGVGASIVANKVPGVRAAFITDSFSAHQGVEEDAMNLMCLGSLVTGQALAWELAQIFLRAQFQEDASVRERIFDMASKEHNSHTLQKYTRTS